MEVETVKLKSEPDYIAPDGSKIFLLTNMKGGGLCLCELPVGAISKAVCHKTVEESWFFLSGEGQLWRKYKDKDIGPVPVTKDMAITIPKGCHFQFKNTGDVPLRFIITTMPPWPGEDEAILVKDYWG